MPVLHLTEDDVDRLLDMRAAIEAVEGAFRALADGAAHNVPRVRAMGKGIVLHSMCAAADYLGLVGWKQYTTTRHGAKFHVGLYDQETGEMLALIAADRLGQLRTGAVTGLAAKYLAPSDVSEVGIIGTGWQAQSQLAAVATVCPIHRAFCYSRSDENRNGFAKKMCDELSIDVHPVDDARAAVADRPIVITATNSRQPVLKADWISPGTLVCAIGSNWLNKAEVDVATVERADLIVCDSVECCQHEAGDFVPAIDQGVFDWSQVVNLAEVVVGRVLPTPAAGSSHTLFKSVGMAIEDVALGSVLLRLAREQNAGCELDMM